MFEASAAIKTAKPQPPLALASFSVRTVLRKVTYVPKKWVKEKATEWSSDFVFAELLPDTREI